MYPTILGFIDSYSLMITIGVVSCLLLANYYLKRKGETKLFIIDFDIMLIIAVLAGFVSACLFQNLYNFIEDPKGYTFTLSITFIGGLIGGVLGFIAYYHLYFKKRHGKCFIRFISIAPASITLAHGFGRIGCFLAGCCYGVVSDSPLAVKFPFLVHKVLPTQLFEAIFLLILALIFSYLILKKDLHYTMCIYLVCYGIFRFVIEYYRGDARGSFIGNISPSQFWSIVMVLGSIPVYFVIKYLLKGNNSNGKAKN